MKVWKKVYNIPLFKTDEKYGAKSIEKMFDPENWEIWPAPSNQEVVYQTFPEFTCLCPRSGYPDFAKIHMVFMPNKEVVELKCLKLWLNSFRDIGISHENATSLIAKTLAVKLKLHRIFVLMEYTPRGNLTTFPMTEINRTESVSKNLEEEYAEIKRLLLKKTIK